MYSSFLYKISNTPCYQITFSTTTVSTESRPCTYSINAKQRSFLQFSAPQILARFKFTVHIFLFLVTTCSGEGTLHWAGESLWEGEAAGTDAEGTSNSREGKIQGWNEGDWMQTLRTHTNSPQPWDGQREAGEAGECFLLFLYLSPIVNCL